jgi:hypothetical protein
MGNAKKMQKIEDAKVQDAKLQEIIIPISRRMHKRNLEEKREINSLKS